MLRILLFCLFLGEIYCHSRIIGGQYAKPGQFPHQISLQVKNRHICGGSLIANDLVVSAAHCVYGQKVAQMSVIAGSVDLLAKNGKTFTIAKILIHPKYNAQTQDFDISLIKLNGAIEPSTYAKPIEMAPADLHIPADTIGIISGFGAVNPNLELPNKLKYAQVQLWSRDYCNSNNVPGITDRMICAGHPSGQVSSCQGDSGGPLTIDNKLVGIVSWGFGCGAKGRPAVYTYVAALLPWIKQNL